MQRFSVLILILIVSNTAFAFFPVERSEAVGADGDQPQMQNAVYYEGQDDAKFQNISDERVESATKPLPDIRGINVTPEEIMKRGQDFDVVALVNKAADVQTLTVYRFKTVDGKRVPEPPVKFPISSGREKWVCGDVVDKKTHEVIGKEARWTGTPTGYYNPYWLHPDHHSSAYDDASMYKAVFFNKMGIATHEAPGSEAKLLGKRESHGCVRLSSAASEQVFKWVLESGGPVNLKSSDFKGICTEQDQRDQDDLEKCKAAAAERSIKWQGVAAAAIEEGHAEGFGPYPSAPQFPDLRTDGTVNRDSAGQPLMKTGYSALYIVECINKAGDDCSSGELNPLTNKREISQPPNCDPNSSGTTLTPLASSAGGKAPPAKKGAPAQGTNPVSGFLKSIFGTAGPSI